MTSTGLSELDQDPARPPRPEELPPPLFAPGLPGEGQGPGIVGGRSDVNPERLLPQGGSVVIPPRIIQVWRWIQSLLLLLVLANLVLVIGLRWVNPPASAFMVRHAFNVWRLQQTPPYYQQTWIGWERIPASVKLAAIAGEDQRFPSHLGFDLIEIRHAIRAYRDGGRLRGASTISQQTAKNLFLWPGSGWERKFLEGWFTLLIETLWSKERILEVYLNIAQFSPGTYGIEATSQRYFGHSASELTLDQAALLIGVLPGPGHYQLDRPSERLQRRADWILDQTRRLGGSRYLRRL